MSKSEIMSNILDRHFIESFIAAICNHLFCKVSRWYFYLCKQVPIGTTILDEDGKTLTALEEERDYYIAARGGAGGKGNSHFATSAETTPRFAEQGGEGEERILYLEMKTMAHAGLVGTLF